MGESFCSSFVHVCSGPIWCGSFSTAVTLLEGVSSILQSVQTPICSYMMTHDDISAWYIISDVFCHPLSIFFYDPSTVSVSKTKGSFADVATHCTQPIALCASPIMRVLCVY